jgi:dihydrolipoamide dehydrogenase
MESFDLIIVGAGPGGYVAAIRAAQLGLKTALVEKRRSLGGTCLNVGCIPSKALLESSELFALASHNLEEHGVGVAGVTLNLPRMMARKEKVVRELTDGIALLMKKNKVTVLTGRGELQAPDRVLVHGDGGDTEVTASSVLLAMGSEPVQLPFLPFDGSKIVSSTEALSFAAVPGHLLVIGAGAVGLELGSVWARLGAEVTVVEMLPTVTPFADRQLATMLAQSLGKQGLKIKLQSKVVAAEVGDRVTVTVEDAKAQTETIVCDVVLVSVGRKPNTEGSGLERLGLEMEGPRIKVDDRFRTNLAGVYAIGDLIRGPMLAHKAEEEGVAVAEIVAGKAGHASADTIPNVVYTQPELAMVGRTEQELKDAGVPFNAGRFYFRANGRAKSMAQEEGLVKILAHAETDRILGVHILGPRASELIAEAVVAMEFAASAEDLARTVHAHPTLSEVVKEAALAVDKRALHS